MFTLIFRLPEYLVQDDILYISIVRSRKGKDERKWIGEVKEELVDEYGADDPDDFGFVCFMNKELEVNFEQDLS